MKLPRVGMRKNRPVKITGVGQLLEFQGEELMVSMITWRPGCDTEIVLTSKERYLER